MIRRRQTSRRLGALTAAVALSLGALTACAEHEPRRDQQVDRERAVTISVNVNSLEQLVLGEVYQRILAHEGRQTVLVMEDDITVSGRMDRLAEGRADFIIGCTGDLLGVVNPTTAEELVDSLESADTPAEEAGAADEVYRAFVGSLPTSTTTTDPSPAQGCTAGQEAELPQNIVPVFRAAMLDGSEVAAVQGVTKLMTTADVSDMMEYARGTDDVTKAVDWWITANNVLPAEADDERGEESPNYLYRP